MTNIVQLDIEGMTCASCALRVEKALNKVEGVEASVNYATERATILADGIALESLSAAVEKAGYHSKPHDDHSTPTDTLRPLGWRLLVAAILTVPVMVLSMIPPLQFIGWQWVATVMSLPVALWAAWPFHRAAAINARHGVATMDTLISLGVLAATGWSLYALFFGGAGELGMTMTITFFGTPGAGMEEIYFEVAAAVTTFMLMGRYLEGRAKRDAGAALRALMETGAIEATLVGPLGEKVVPIAFVKPGDVMLVRPGERIPTDGTVIEGFAAVDTSMMTGESLPREVGPGDALWGGTINTSGLLRVEATKVGSDTELARMAALVEKAQTGKSETQRLADRVSAVFVPIVIVISLITLFGWIFIGGSSAIAFQAAVATLIIACPCALGLATPTALLVGTGRGAQLGLLIRGPEVLETSRKIDTVVLDKTGTLTTGVMQVAEMMTSSGMSEAELLRVAASVEYGSEHPIARAIVRTALERSLTLSEATDFVAFAGFGVGATIDLADVLAGTPAWLVERGFTLEGDLASRIEVAREQGTVIAVASAGSVVGALVVTDTVRETSAQAVENLRALGITPVMASGDHESVARRVADQVGIETVYSALTPQGKAELVAKLQSAGHAVAMVGDGINDAPALATADLGIAMGSGTDAAMTAGDITIVSGDVLAISDGLRLAQRTLRTIQANLFWAFAYNVAAIPLAVAGLLNPIIAGLAMALSSVFVVTNSLRLRSFRPTR